MKKIRNASTEGQVGSRIEMNEVGEMGRNHIVVALSQVQKLTLVLKRVRLK